MSACDGRCCAVFYMAFSHAEVRERSGAFARHGDADKDYIADMAIPLTKRRAISRARRFGLSGDWLKADDDHWYSCRHWDEETRLCTAYEQRPAMCRDFPYDSACAHCGYREAEAVQAEWRERTRFPWARWRWSSRLGGYRPKDAPPSVDWEPGQGWTWDGRVMRPERSDYEWDHRRRKWRAAA